MTAGSLAIGVGTIAQTIGAVLIVRGLTQPRKTQATSQHGGRLAIVPIGTPNGAGVSISGGF